MSEAQLQLISPEDENNLRHMSGSDSRYTKKQWGFRNYFCSSTSGSDFESMKRLEEKGYVVQRRGFDNDSIYFHATESGLKHLGFNAKQMDNAFDRRTLHLHLKYHYFDQIKAGLKPEEFRLAEKYKDDLDNKRYTHIRLYRAYQKVSPETVLDGPYRGYELKTITHPHFLNVPKEVCAIDVSHMAGK